MRKMDLSPKNYYQILQVQTDAPFEVIRRNYKILLKKLRMHPDLGGENSDATMINIAYETLSNPEKRLRYDQILIKQTCPELNYESLHTSSRISPEKSEEFCTTAMEKNQRNYYRILQVHPDAHPTVIKERFKDLWNKSDLPCKLVHEAYLVLTDPVKRSEYDTLLKTHKHAAAVKIMQTGYDQLKKDIGSHNDTFLYDLPYLRNKSDNDSVRLPSFSGISCRSDIFMSLQPSNIRCCEFCKTPHCSTLKNEYMALCSVCDSPLFFSKIKINGRSTRYLARLKRSENIVFYVSWPGSKFTGSLIDISPTGLRFCTSVEINTGRIIKINGKDFKAVAEIIHSRVDCNIKIYGACFYTLYFNTPKGNFIFATA